MPLLPRSSRRAWRLFLDKLFRQHGARRRQPIVKGFRPYVETMEGRILPAQITPVISWNDPPDISYGTPLDATELNASANVAGTFTYTLADDLTPAGGAVLNAGQGQTLNVAFAPMDAVDYTSATDSVVINVDPASQSIAFPVLDPAPYGVPITLSASGGNSGNAVTFTVVSGPGTLNSDTLTFTGLGNVVVEADQAGDANFAAASPVQRTVLVTPTFSTAVSESENGTPITTTVAKALAGHFSDSDRGAKPGIAVFQTGGNGTWQYSANGSTWSPLGGVAPAQALLLPTGDSLRFVPTANSSGLASLDFVAWDGSQGKAGGKADISVRGGATPFSIDAGELAVTVTPVNHAPTWAGSAAAFTSVAPGAYALTGATPAGDLVSSLFGTAFHDTDGNSAGIAVTGITGTTHGVWQYSTDNGTTWTSFGTTTTTFKVPALTNALLLPGTDLLRFVPSAGFTGAATLTANAWDGTQGAAAGAGATVGVKITGTGGATAFSTATLTATVQINAAPTLSAASITPFTAISEGAATTAVTAAALLHSAGASADATGVAIVATSGTGGSGTGTWQYLLAGATVWTALPAVSEASAFLLPSTAALRFLSATTQHGTAALTLRAWDGTAGAAGKLFAIAATGGTTSISSAETTASVTVNPINHAPTWTAATAPFKPELANATPTGDLVSDVFGGSFSDLDGNPVGIAVIGVTGIANGTWGYSLDGTNWTTFGAAATTFKVPSMTNALLLPAGDLVRFVPNANFTGMAALTVLAWDGTHGAAASGAAIGFNITAEGGNTAFSSASLNAPLLVHVAPTLTTLTPAVFPAAIVEGATTASVTVAALLADAHASPSAKGVAIVGASGTGGAGSGVWQYQLAGTTTWTNLPAVSESSGFLLLGMASLRFQSITNQNGMAALTFRAWDGAKTMPGTLIPITHTGGATAVSDAEAAATVTVNPINHAPTWTGTTFALPVITSNTASPAGESISQLVGSSFTDLDAVSHVGVAILGATGGATGVWQFFNGTSWTPLGSLTAAAARLLSGADLVRYVPNPGFNGTATLTVRPWDGSTGSDFAVVNLSATISTGGHTAFGATSGSITQLVHDAPTLGNTAPTVAPWAIAINEGAASAAVTVATLMHDATVGASAKGLAIVGAAGGAWQYLAAGSTVWTALPSVSETSAFLLPSTASIRLQAASNQHGSATLTFRAWDGSAGTADKLFAVAGTGGTTALSSTEASANLTVNAVNHAPTWTGTAPTLTPVVPGVYSLTGAAPPGDEVSSVFGSNFTDIDGNSPGIAITALTGTANGAWQYSADGINWTAIPITGANKVSPTAALLLPGSYSLRFVPNANFLGAASLTVYAWDGTTGTAAQSVNLATLGAIGGKTAFSTTALTATVVVNTAPVIA